MFPEVVRQELRLLTFRDCRIDLEKYQLPFLTFAIFATWLAGVGRYWDHPSAYWWQYAGLGSVVYVGVLSIILWLIGLPLRPQNWRFLTVFVFVGLTAPPAWLYALPVERFLPIERAATVNMLFLLFVAVWRVMLYSFFLRRLAKLSGLAWFSALFLPLAGIVTVLSMLNLENAVFQIMGGLDREPTAADKSYGVVVALSFVSVLAAPVILVCYLVASIGAWKQNRSSNSDAG
jgi:hypothetical protein